MLCSLGGDKREFSRIVVKLSMFAVVQALALPMHDCIE